MTSDVDESDSEPEYTKTSVAIKDLPQLKSFVALRGIKLKDFINTAIESEIASIGILERAKEKSNGAIVKPKAGKRPIIMSDAGENETITPVPELRDVIKESIAETAVPPAEGDTEGCSCNAPLWKKGDNGKRFCELCGYEEGGNWMTHLM